LVFFLFQQDTPFLLLFSYTTNKHSSFGNFHQQTFKHFQKLNLDGLIGRAQSVSYLPRDKQTQQQLITELQSLCNRWADESGQVSMIYQT
ncbi:MAG: hypothetical protein K6T90_22425, partial [Leptolyngbyaceae cyanobacterium HOT.MB2.61]|nr:hypothetical protein [Leptolyngbyaceae cyanobacterium HOT.MB2.61]